jgi:plastocyanin
LVKFYVSAESLLSTDVWQADLSQDPVPWEPGPPEMPNVMADVVLVPEAYSPTVSLSWEYDLLGTSEQEPEPAVLLYGRSWTYEPGSHNPILGDAATWLFWPNGALAGPLAGITVWPEDAVVEAGHTRVFNATGHDANGFYVPITPTWGATGGVIDDLGRYTAGDWPGTYYVAAVTPPAKSPTMLRDEVPVTITGTETCPDLPPGSSWSHTFAYTGTFPYHDRVGTKHYTGTVVVNDTLLDRSTATHDISITAIGFDPVQVVIARNDTVRWTNNDTVPHAVSGGEYNKPYYYLHSVLLRRG